jgi:hypothetical protein
MAIIDIDLDPIWNVNSGPLGLDFKVNQNYLTYFDRINQSWILMNSAMREIDTLTCINSYYADYHDIQILPNGGYILQAYDSTLVDMNEIVEGGDPNALVKGLIIQEFDASKNLIFEWNAWDHLNIEDYTNLDLQADWIVWLHGNSIEIDFDNHLLISNRRSSEILKINRTTGDVIWHMGGPLNQFSFINDPLGGFSKQHDVRRLENGNLILFDNGNTHNPPFSRALEYEVDEDNMTAELVWSFVHPDSILGVAMGSIQRLPNQHTLINWGTETGTGTTITEVDQNNTTVLEIQLPEEFHSYKVRKNHWQFETNFLSGDVNQDDSIDIFDLLILIDYSNDDEQILDMFHLFRFDINRDRQIDINDSELLIETILNNYRFLD